MDRRDEVGNLPHSLQNLTTVDVKTGGSEDLTAAQPLLHEQEILCRVARAPTLKNFYRMRVELRIEMPVVTQYTVPRLLNSCQVVGELFQTA